MKHSLAPRRAFTLIEILVVIAIIGILSAILFPVLSRARENGRKTACLSNMKQLGMAFQQYQQDSRGKYPLAGNYQAWNPGFGHWVTGGVGGAGSSGYLAAVAEVNGDFPYVAGKKSDVTTGALFPYVKSNKVYRCPSNRDGEDKGLSYSMNCAVSGLSSSRILSPGDIILLVDEEYATDGFFWAANTKVYTGNGNSTDKLTTKHNGGGNFLFADGHVKYFPFDSFPLDSSDQGLINKGKLTGSPRFHDRSFGSGTGSSMVPFQNTPGNLNATGVFTPSNLDSCIVSPTATPVP